MEMSLVAYDSSDEGSGNEEDESAGSTIANNANNNATEVTTNLKLSLPAPKVVSESTNDEKEEEEENTGNFENFFGMLPKPKDLNSSGSIEEDDEILLKKETENRPIVKPVKKQTVKITVPSLSEVNVYVF